MKLYFRSEAIPGPGYGIPPLKTGIGVSAAFLRCLWCVFLLSVVPVLVCSQPILDAASTTNGTMSDPLCDPELILGGLNVKQREGTRRMIERLAKLHLEAKANPERHPYLNTELVDFYRQALIRAVQTSNWQQALNIHPRLAIHLLFSGQSEKALQTFESFQVQARKFGGRLDQNSLRQISIYHALCHLRIGEQENCLAHHTTESCLIPIRGTGVHTLPRGSEGAVTALTAHLKQFQGDLEARWLLNIAYMTLGRYPNDVPSEWLIPPTAFEADFDIKRFPDVAGDLGLDVDGLAGGSIVEDFDGDGYLDVLFSSWSLDGQLRFFLNNADGTFTERTAETGLTGMVGGLNILQTDYNNDGLPDVFIPRGAWLGAGGHHPNSLLRNNGDGGFEDVTEEAGLLSFHPTQTATWFDFDSDGWLDLFIGNESSEESVHPCELYRNNGDGTFTECALESGVAVTLFLKGVANGDYNNDGRPDLYLSNRDGANVLFRNDGPSGGAGGSESKWKFTDVTTEAGVAEPQSSFPTWFWDYDNDGWLDILVTGYSTRGVEDIAADYLGLPHPGERARLYRNKGDGTFADLTNSSNLYKVLLGMGANFGDLDNDGWLDFYVGTGDPDFSMLIPNRMFRNAGGKHFQEVTASGGFGHIQKGHGISFADFDNDGDQDVFIKIGGAYSGDNYRSSLFQNPGHGNHWIAIKLEGVRSNHAAIGARIRVLVETSEGNRSIYKTVGSGGSFGASPLRQEIGLGQAKSIRQVEIQWPGETEIQVLHGLEMDRFYKVREGTDSAVAWDLRTFTLARVTHSHVPSHRHHPE